jgi:hypothetical protein
VFEHEDLFIQELLFVQAAIVRHIASYQFAMQLLAVRDRLGEKAAVAQAASSLTYPKIHKE